MTRYKKRVSIIRVQWLIILVLLVAVIAQTVRIAAIGKTEAPITLATAAPITTIDPVLTMPKPSPPEPKEPELKSLGMFKLSAYCPCVKCCEIWSAEHPSRVGTDYVQKTKSGTIPEANRTIGVDPKVIPLGTSVYINGNEYIAEDIGGGVNGNHIDVYHATHKEALVFGLQEAEVFIKNQEELK